MQSCGAVATIFGGAIGNSSEHSNHRGGCAVQQTCPVGKTVRIALSHVGVAILESLRPAPPAEGDLTDKLCKLDVIVKIYVTALSG